jgi:hypothetical protein
MADDLSQRGLVGTWLWGSRGKVVGADRKLTQVFYLLCLNFGQGVNKVISMEMLGRIRRMHWRDKVSLHEVAKRTGLSRNTVRSWFRTPQEVPVPTYSRKAGFKKPWAAPI